MNSRTSLIARGKDGQQLAHLKNLGPQAIRSFTDLCNLSVLLNVSPTPWKLASNILFLRHSKTSCSLLCTPSKILERLVIDKIYPYPACLPCLHSTSPLVSSLMQRTLKAVTLQTRSQIPCSCHRHLQGLRHGSQSCSDQ